MLEIVGSGNACKTLKLGQTKFGQIDFVPKFAASAAKSEEFSL
jgi:hypothetical protein